jgi:ketosteroid isomerase-like protein
MKTLPAAALTAVLVCSVAVSQTTEKPEEQLRQLDRAWAEAITNGDVPTLERLFADDMIVTSGSGVIRDKAGEIKDAASGSTDPDFSWTRSFTTEDVRVKVYKDASVYTLICKGVESVENCGPAGKLESLSETISFTRHRHSFTVFTHLVVY